MGYIITMPFYNASVWLVWARVVLLENGEERLITCEFGYLVLRLVIKMHVSLSCMLSLHRDSDIVREEATRSSFLHKKSVISLTL